MTRKSPIRHKVLTYQKDNGTVVNDYVRGHGSNQTHIADPTIIFHNQTKSQILPTQSFTAPIVEIVDDEIYKINLPYDATISETLMRQFLHDCAEHVLPLFASEYPNDNRPQIALTAIQTYINDSTDSNRQKMLEAVDEADDAIDKEINVNENAAQSVVNMIHEAALATYSERHADAVIRSMWESAEDVRDAAQNIHEPDNDAREQNLIESSESDWQQNHLNELIRNELGASS